VAQFVGGVIFAIDNAMLSSALVTLQPLAINFASSALVR
jgi:hypothetical protein